MKESFPTFRAWRVLLNRSVHLGRAGLALFAGAILLFAPIGLSLSALKFLIAGTRTTGVVTAKVPVSAAVRTQFPIASLLAMGGRKAPHYLSYEFRDASGTLRKGQTYVTNSVWSATRIGDPIEVLYLDSDPSLSRAWPAWSADSLGLWAFGVVGFGLLVFAGYSISRGILATRSTIALLREGSVTEGSIVEIDGRAGKIEYRYRASLNVGERPAALFGTYTFVARRQKGVAGDVVRVVYDPREPETSTLDLFFLRVDERKKGKHAHVPINRS